MSSDILGETVGTIALTVAFVAFVILGFVLIFAASGHMDIAIKAITSPSFKYF